MSKSLKFWFDLSLWTNTFKEKVKIPLMGWNQDGHDVRYQLFGGATHDQLRSSCPLLTVFHFVILVSIKWHWFKNLVLLRVRPYLFFHFPTWSFRLLRGTPAPETQCRRCQAAGLAGWWWWSPETPFPEFNDRWTANQLLPNETEGLETSMRHQWRAALWSQWKHNQHS